jgi:hypothetical protein
VLNHNPGLDWDIHNSGKHLTPADWIGEHPRIQTGLFSGRNSRLQELKNPVDWMVIQATGLINPNQAESPRGILMKIQSTG